MSLRSAGAGAALIASVLCVPPVIARDARLVTRMFNADEIVVIEGRAGVQATIAFADDEHIENVAIGDSTSWQVTPNKRANLLFVKPLSPRGRTNLTVVTDRHTYMFDLVAGATTKPVYVLRFTYPASEKPPVKVAAAISSEEAQAISSPPQEPVTDPALLNFAWRSRGDKALLPSRIYDDGQATYLLWDERNPQPAILVRNAKGEEGAVNYAVRGKVIVLDTVPGVIVLRSGKAVATIENQGPPRPPARDAKLAATVPSAGAAPAPVAVQGQ
ncbi:MAG: TrbG/VirB9 family P-type conjugative transfer protein [Novosphingobium sp.]